MAMGARGRGRVRPGALLQRVNPDEMVDTAGKDAAPAGPTLVRLKKLRIETEFWNQVQDLPKDERMRYSSMIWNMMRMDSGPRVKVQALVGAEQNVSLDYQHEGSLKQSLDFYHRRNHEELIPVLKYYACYLLQQARNAGNQQRQLFQIFKAVDLLRMVSQYSPFSINVQAETIVFQIFIDLGQQLPQQFRKHMDVEGKIMPVIRQLKQYPGDNNNRLFLAQFYARQTSYADALVQYDLLLKLYPKIPVAQDINRAVVWIQLGRLFENLLPQDLPGRMRDSRKLKAFAERYNRDYVINGHRLPLISKRLSARELQQIRTVLHRIAMHFYQQALRVTVMERKSMAELALKVGEYYISRKHYKAALNLLLSVNDFINRMPKSLANLESRMRFLQMVQACSRQVKKAVTETWAREEIARLDPVLAETRAQTDEIEKHRKTLVEQRQAAMAAQLEEDETPMWKRQPRARRQRE